ARGPGLLPRAVGSREGDPRGGDLSNQGAGRVAGAEADDEVAEGGEGEGEAGGVGQALHGAGVLGSCRDEIAAVVGPAYLPPVARVGQWFWGTWGKARGWRR